MKKFNYLLFLLCFLLAGCGNSKLEQNVVTNDIENLISTNDVHFDNTSSLEFVHYFVTNKDIIRDDTNYFKNDSFKNYIYTTIDIEETTFTGCEAQGYFADWFDDYIDETITNCSSSSSVGYSITIPGGKYEAFVPTDTTVTTCSTTNPIVCWGYKSAEEVKDYYFENNECPTCYRHLGAGVSGPTDVCSRAFWMCRKKICGGVSYCDINEGVECFWNFYGGGVELGDPCDFFLGIGIVPADGSCDYKLNS